MAEVRPGTGLLPYEEARGRILASVEEMAPIELPLQEAVGCVLATDMVAEFDLPEFSAAMVEGFAVRASDVASASPRLPVSLRVAGRVEVGQPPSATVGWGEAVRVPLGGPMPAGSDCVVPSGQAVLEGETVRVLGSPAAGDSVRPSGVDVRAGQTLIPAGRKLAAPELALLAATGHPSALVFPRPRAIVLTTGHDLVEPGRPAAFGQVRDASSFTMFGALKELGAVPYLAGIVADDAEAYREEVLSHLITADCFLSPGAATLADPDALRRAFFKRGDVARFEVAMEPGGQHAFGTIEGKPFFGLPSDPVAVFVSFEVFVRPALLKMMGRRDLARPEVSARLRSDLVGSPERVAFARVRVWMENGRWRAEGLGDADPGLVSSISGANGLAVVPAGTERLRAGREVRVMVFRPLQR